MATSTIAASEPMALKSADGTVLPDPEADTTAAGFYASVAEAAAELDRLTNAAHALGAESWTAAICPASQLDTTPAPAPSRWRAFPTDAELAVQYPTPEPVEVELFAIVVGGGLHHDSSGKPLIIINDRVALARELAAIKETLSVIGEPERPVRAVGRTAIMAMNDWQTIDLDDSAPAAEDTEAQP